MFKKIKAFEIGCLYKINWEKAGKTTPFYFSTGYVKPGENDKAWLLVRSFKKDYSGLFDKDVYVFPSEPQEYLEFLVENKYFRPHISWCHDFLEKMDYKKEDQSLAERIRKHFSQ